MAKVLMSIETSAAPPTPESVRRRFALGANELDAAFGVVPVDPDAGIYTVRVEEAALPRMGSRGGWVVSGPFSDPRIAPFPLPAAAPGGDDPAPQPRAG